MDNKTLYPQWDGVISDENFLSRDFEVLEEFEKHIGVSKLLSAYVNDKSPNETHGEIESFLERVIALKEDAIGVEAERIEFLLLVYTSDLIKVYNTRGAFHYCYNLFTLAIQDRILARSETYDFNADRIFKCLDTSDGEITKHAEIVLVSWLGQLYYYSRSFSGLNEWCDYIVEDVMQFTDGYEGISTDFAFFMSNVSSWLEYGYGKYKAEEKFMLRKSIKLEKMLDSNSPSPLVESVRFGLVSNKHLDRESRKSFSLRLQDHEWFNFITMVQYELTNFMESFTDVTFDTLLNKVDMMVSQIETGHELNDLQERSRISKIFGGFITHCFKIQDSEKISSLISRFYNKTGPSNEPIIIVPNSIEGTQLLWKSHVVKIPHDPHKQMVSLTKCRNLTFNLSVLLKGMGIDEDIPGGPPGVPNEKHGRWYEKELAAIYDFAQLPQSPAMEATSMLQYDYNSLPIQTMMIKQIGETKKVQVSFSRKVDSKHTENVLFWKGNSITSEREYASVSSIFDSAGIQVKCCSDSKEEFLNEMKHNYDIVWISSHGEHEHYDPVNSKIVLSDEQNILLSDFERMKNLNKDTTRLIFSNTCEGSKSAQTGELLNIGFPYLLTDSNQDFLSHLWMVNFQIAPIYASLYAIHISEGESFFTAYQNTVKDLLEGKDRVLEILGTAGNLSPVQELAESLSNIDSIDFSNILTWGSSAYYT